MEWMRATARRGRAVAAGRFASVSGPGIAAAPPTPGREVDPPRHKGPPESLRAALLLRRSAAPPAVAAGRGRLRLGGGGWQGGRALGLVQGQAGADVAVDLLDGPGQGGQVVRQGAD